MAKAKASNQITNPRVGGRPAPLVAPGYPRNPYQSPNPTEPTPTPVQPIYTGDYGGGNPYAGLGRPPFPVNNPSNPSGSTGNQGGAGTGTGGTGSATPTNPYPVTPSPADPSNPTGGGTSNPTTPTNPINPGTGTGATTNPYNPYAQYDIPYAAQPLAPDTHGYYDTILGYGRDEYTAQADAIYDAQRKGNIAAYNAYLNAINPYGIAQERLAMGNQVNSGVRDYSRQRAYRNMRDYIVDANATANQSYLDLILAYQKQLEAEREAGLTT